MLFSVTAKTRAILRPAGVTTDDDDDDDDDFGDGSLLEKDSFAEFPAPAVPPSSASFVGGGQQSIASTLTSKGWEGPSSNSGGVGDGDGTQSPQLALLLPFVPRLVSHGRWRRTASGDDCGPIELR